MRLALIACVVSMTAVVSAQTGTKGAPVTKGAAASPPPHQTPAPPRPAPPPAAPRTVPPPIIFPQPPVTPPPAGGLTPPVVFTPPLPAGARPVDMFRTGTGRRDPYRTRFYAPGLVGYGGYGFGGYETSAPEPEAADAAAARPATGILRLSVTPASAQVFIDSYYVGTVADIEAGRALALAAGPHHLEIRAPDYQTLAVDIRIAPYDTLTYRAALERVPPAAPSARSGSAAAAPMYLIPNCYLGNVPPRPNRLPSGCDIKRVQVLGAR